MNAPSRFIDLSRADAAHEPRAGLDVLHERHTMLTKLGYTLADEDGLVRQEMIVAAVRFVDEASDRPPPAVTRAKLVRAAALLIAEIERIDRAGARLSS